MGRQRSFRRSLGKPAVSRRWKRPNSPTSRGWFSRQGGPFSSWSGATDSPGAPGGVVRARSVAMSLATLPFDRRNSPGTDPYSRCPAHGADEMMGGPPCQDRVGTLKVIRQKLEWGGAQWPAWIFPYSMLHPSPRGNRRLTRGPRPNWFAIPYLYGSFIRYSPPAFTGAFPDTFSSACLRTNATERLSTTRQNKELRPLARV